MSELVQEARPERPLPAAAHVAELGRLPAAADVDHHEVGEAARALGEAFVAEVPPRATRRAGRQRRQPDRMEADAGRAVGIGVGELVPGFHDARHLVAASGAIGLRVALHVDEAVGVGRRGAERRQVELALALRLPAVEQPVVVGIAVERIGLPARLGRGVEPVAVGIGIAVAISDVDEHVAPDAPRVVAPAGDDVLELVAVHVADRRERARRERREQLGRQRRGRRVAGGLRGRGRGGRRRRRRRRLVAHAPRAVVAERDDLLRAVLLLDHDLRAPLRAGARRRALRRAEAVRRVHRPEELPAADAARDVDDASGEVDREQVAEPVAVEVGDERDAWLADVVRGEQARLGVVQRRGGRCRDGRRRRSLLEREPDRSPEQQRRSRHRSLPPERARR